MAFDQMKMLNELRKAQKELKKEKVIVAAGGTDDEPAVEITFNAELKIEDVQLNAAYVAACVQDDELDELEDNIKAAVRDGLAKAQEIAAEKMKPLMGGLGNLGL